MKKNHHQAWKNVTHSPSGELAQRGVLSWRGEVTFKSAIHELWYTEGRR